MGTRHYQPEDLDDIFRLETLCFPEFPTPLDVLRTRLNQPQTYCLVEDVGSRIIGFMLYRKTNRSIILDTIAVEPTLRRQGIASRLFSRLVDDRDELRVKADVRERNLTAQQFLRSVGMRCVATKKGLYDCCEDDAYVFEKFPTGACAGV